MRQLNGIEFSFQRNLTPASCTSVKWSLHARFAGTFPLSVPDPGSRLSSLFRTDA